MSHVIAVDGSLQSEAAFDYAAKVLPKDEKFVIVHGRHHNLVLPGTIKSTEMAQLDEYYGLMDKFQKKCKETQVTVI
jgi:hypothetical protein